jgi:hypothetical protein
MTKENIKQALISICIGAGIAFFTTLFQGLLDFMTDELRPAVAGVSSSLYYLLKNFRV